MQIVKIILGMICLIVALFWGGISWGIFISGGMCLTLVPAIFTLGLVSIGLILIFKSSSALPAGMKRLMLVFFSFLIFLGLAVDLRIRYERHELQNRAKAFLERPIPKLLIPDAEGYVGGYYVDTNSGVANGVFGYSRVLIERYATKGRIRWPAAIQGEFAATGDNCLNPNISEDVINNPEVRAYSAESHAILAEEWRMGLLQFFEDTIEFKLKIPEIEEEDQYNGIIEQLEGTWTNENSEVMTISNGTFSAKWVSPAGTNMFKGTQVFYGAKSVLKAFRDTTNTFLQEGDEKDIEIIHVDDHNLIYELGGQTNHMQR